MKLYLTRRYFFSASHRLHNHAFTPEKNLETYGKCNNPYGHGHNYALEVTVSGRLDPLTGMVCDLVELDNIVQREIIERFDHENLNCMAEFADSVPTSENLAMCIYDVLALRYKAAHVEKVRLEETSMNSCEYSGGAEIKH